MVNRIEAKNIAGKIFVGEFDRDYLIENKEKFTLTEYREKGKLVFDFCMFKYKPEDINVIEDGITVHEKDFPDILLTVAVSLNDGKGEILFKTDKVN